MLVVDGALESRAGLPVRLVRSQGLRTLLLVAFVGWLLIEGLERMGGPQAIRDEYGSSLALVFVPVQAIVAVSPVPGELVAFASSAIHGFWLGSLLNWLGWMMAAYMEYGLVRWTARDVEFDRARLPRWLRNVPADHPLFLMAGRFLPFGSHIVNSMSGLHGISLWRFTWTSAIAIVPSAVFFGALANGLVGEW